MSIVFVTDSSYYVRADLLTKVSNFAEYTKCPKKLTFLDTHTYGCVSEDKKYWIFGKFCERAK